MPEEISGNNKYNKYGKFLENSEALYMPECVIRQIRK
jgi:hypothetical protein